MHAASCLLYSQVLHYGIKQNPLVVSQVDACSELFAIQSDTALWNKAKHTMLCSCLSIELQLRAILPSGLCMQMRLWGSQFTSQDTL